MEARIRAARAAGDEPLLLSLLQEAAAAAVSPPPPDSPDAADSAGGGASGDVGGGGVAGGANGEGGEGGGAGGGGGGGAAGAPTPPPPLRRVCFVCTGNTCRSPMAMLALRSLHRQTAAEEAAQAAWAQATAGAGAAGAGDATAAAAAEAAAEALAAAAPLRSWSRGVAVRSHERSLNTQAGAALRSRGIHQLPDTAVASVTAAAASVVPSSPSSSSSSSVASSGVSGLTPEQAAKQALRAAAAATQSSSASSSSSQPSSHAHVAQPMTADDVAAADVIVAMTRAHRTVLLQAFPEAAAKTTLLLSFSGHADDDADLLDPYGESFATYLACLDRIVPAVRQIAKRASTTSSAASSHSRRTSMGGAGAAAYRHHNGHHHSPRLHAPSPLPPSPQLLPSASPAQQPQLMQRLRGAPTPAVASPAAAVERRFDSDGVAYTRAEFVEYFGGSAEWDAAPHAPAPPIASDVPPTATAAAPPPSAALTSAASRAPQPTKDAPLPFGVERSSPEGRRSTAGATAAMAATATASGGARTVTRAAAAAATTTQRSAGGAAAAARAAAEAMAARGERLGRLGAKFEDLAASADEFASLAASLNGRNGGGGGNSGGGGGGGGAKGLLGDLFARPPLRNADAAATPSPRKPAAASAAPAKSPGQHQQPHDAATLASEVASDLTAVWRALVSSNGAATQDFGALADGGPRSR